MIGAMKLDNRDLQILTILQAEGRITKSELAARVSLSPAACWDRLKRLDQAGFIRGYHAEVALEKIAPASQFLVQIELESNQTGDFTRFANAVRPIPQVPPLNGRQTCALPISTATVRSSPSSRRRGASPSRSCPPG